MNHGNQEMSHKNVDSYELHVKFDQFMSMCLFFPENDFIHLDSLAGY